MNEITVKYFAQKHGLLVTSVNRWKVQLGITPVGTAEGKTKSAYVYRECELDEILKLKRSDTPENTFTVKDYAQQNSIKGSTLRKRVTFYELTPVGWVKQNGRNTSWLYKKEDLDVLAGRFIGGTQ